MARWLLLPVLVLPFFAGAASGAQRDRDHDRLPDRWEKRYHLSTKKKSGKGDADRDGLRNRREYRLRTNPRKKDTDGDGLRDRAEVRRYKTNPRKQDTDGDGRSDGLEVRAGTNPRKKDTDGDGYSDKEEIHAGTDPKDAASHPPGSPSPTPTPAPGPVGGRCDLSATPTNFASQVSAAVSGQVICLATGDYGTWWGTNKSITLRKAEGATPSMRFGFGSGDANFVIDGVSGAGGRIDGGVSNVTVKNSAFNTCLEFYGAQTNVVFDNNTHNNIDATCGNSRLRLNASGVTVRNSEMVGGDADGAFVGSSGFVFEGNHVAPCHIGGPTDNHTDGLQYADPGDPANGYAGVVRGNYFDGRACPGLQSLSSYDGGTDGALWEDNVIDTTRPWGIELYADEASIVRHNTVRYYPASGCAFGTPCGRIDVTHKSGDPRSTGTQVYDNVAQVATADSVMGRNDHNTNPATVIFVGPLTGWAGFELAPGSSGAGAASDGLNTGIRVP